MVISEVPLIGHLRRKEAKALRVLLRRQEAIERNIALSPDAEILKQCRKDAGGDEPVAQTLFYIRDVPERKPKH